MKLSEKYFKAHIEDEKTSGFTRLVQIRTYGAICFLEGRLHEAYDYKLGSAGRIEDELEKIAIENNL